MPSDTKSPTVKSLAADLEALAEQVADLARRLSALEAWTPEARRLSLEEVQEIMAASRNAEFDVLADWSHGGRVFRGGQVVRADLYPHLADYVRAGLPLAIPADTSDRAREAIRLADAQRELAQAQTEAARAMAAKAQLADALDSLAS